MKCRLCLCFVDKQLGYSSLLDNGFNKMIQHVLSFAMTPEDTIPGNLSNLSVMVCNQCFTTVRNFYSFYKMVEANQKTLRTECTEPDAGMSIDEFVQCIKQENGLEHHERNIICNNAITMSTEVETIGGENNISTTPKGQIMNERLFVPTEVGSTCIDKREIMEQIAIVEKRINIVTAELSKAVRSIPHLSTAQHSVLPSFAFSPINSEAELISFNHQLADEQFLKVFLDWFDTKSEPESSADLRMHEAIDIVFSRPFLAECSWTGVSTKGKRKIPLMKFKEVVELFRLIGSQGGYRISDQKFRKFFFRKLRRAKERLNLQGSRKSVCRVSRINRIS